MGRIQDAFATAKKEGRPAVGIYLVAGHPDLDTSLDHIRAAIDAGADMIEVGLPFSDPAADGPIIQAATAAALRHGLRVQDALTAVKRLRDERPDAALVCMTYANIIHTMGWHDGMQRLVDAGFDGVILPDVPLEESDDVREACDAAGLDWIPLVAPTTPDDRMAAIAATAIGFLYVVGNVGITGQDDPGPLVEATVERVRSAGGKVPIAVGFGLRTREHVQRIHDAGADGAIIGSALVAAITDGASAEATGQAVAALAGSSKP